MKVETKIDNEPIKVELLPITIGKYNESGEQMIFTKKEVVEFGNYLLSDFREDLYRNHPESENMQDVEERLKEVSHADMMNWREWSEGVRAEQDN